MEKGTYRRAYLLSDEEYTLVAIGLNVLRLRPGYLLSKDGAELKMVQDLLIRLDKEKGEMTTPSQDFTPTGLKIEGPAENDRNAANRDLFKAIIREAYNVTDVIVAHHLTYVATDKRDGFSYEIVEEIPSADTLIFDHDVAKKLWGTNAYKDVLARLAIEPCETRDELLGKMLAAREHPPRAFETSPLG